MIEQLFIFMFGKQDETGQPSKDVTCQILHKNKCTLWNTGMGLKIWIYYLAFLNRNLQESWIQEN